MSSRWDYLFEAKPVPLVEHLLDEVAKLLAKDLAQWPPPVEELDPRTGAQFQPLFEPDRPRPADAVYGEAFRLAKWELEREIDAIGDYLRNRRWLALGLSEDDKLAIVFLSRWLTEQLLSLREYTESRVSRPQLVDCLDRTRRRLAEVRGALLPN